MRLSQLHIAGSMTWVCSPRGGGRIFNSSNFPQPAAPCGEGSGELQPRAAGMLAMRVEPCEFRLPATDALFMLAANGR